MKEHIREEPKILAAAERQMHNWALRKELNDREVRHKVETAVLQGALNFVAISREAGCGAASIGHEVGERLGWEVFDKNLLDRIADRFHVPRAMLAAVDETGSNWVYDVLETWMDHKLVPHEKYFAYLSRVVRTAARSGHAVFVGRGVQFLLPRSEILAVRLIASLKYRVRQIMEQLGMREHEARQFIAEVDKGRGQFGVQFFHHDITDPHCYDLVINVERCGETGAVEQILTALRR